MALQSISKSFKGILRIANVQEATIKEEDYFFNPIYYGIPTKGIANESTGYNSAYNALTGSLIRYSFPDDPYKHSKVPITDSLGNYMNINIGADSITIGSDELNNGNNADRVTFTQLLDNKSFTQDKIFPVVQAPKLIIGLKERVLPEAKNSINDGTITIDSSPYFDSVDAKLIVNNNFDHSPNHINGESFVAINGVSGNNRTHRTIYQNTNGEVREYDALVHYQDNIDEHNLKTNQTIDAIVDVINLKDYVKEKLNLYLGHNTVEVPTGMIIWQYINLTKWYCITQTTASSTLLEDPYMGNNPPMGRVQDIDNFTPTLYQGVVRKGINKLVAKSFEEDESDVYTNKQLKEMIPLYKRDYTLANGDTFTIHMLLPEMADNYNYQSYDRFIDLFFAIGYQYTDLEVIRDHYENAYKEHVNGMPTFKWKNNIRTASKKCTNKDVLFGVDLMTMLAIKAIYEELKTGTSNNGKSACVDPATNQFSRERAEAWLQNQPIPRQFIFNTPIPASSNGMVYEYTPVGEPNPGTYKIEIGEEVNSFKSYLWYFDHALEVHSNPGGLHDRVTIGGYRRCPAWQTAEVQSVLDLFVKININREKELKNYFTFPFQVTNLMQDVENNYTTGTFIGFSPFVWANENKFSTQLASVSTFSSSAHPHRHAIFMGPKTFKEKPDWYEHTGIATATSMARADGHEQFFAEENGGIITTVTAEEFKKNININSYTMAEMNGLRYDVEINGGMPTYTIQWNQNTKKDHPDPRWRNAEPNRGITSPPIDEGIIDQKFRTASANTLTGEVKWFQPEFIQMVPLIKL